MKNKAKNAESLEAVTHTHTHTQCLLQNWWTVWRESHILPKVVFIKQSHTSNFIKTIEGEKAFINSVKIGQTKFVK